MTDTKTVTAPVSLAAIKAGVAYALARCKWCDEEGTANCPGCKTMKRVPALVELAEAYLAVRDMDPTYGPEDGVYVAALDRLALAAKGVKP